MASLTTVCEASGFSQKLHDTLPESRSSANRRMLGYPVGRQLRDILPALLLSLAMAALVYPITLLGLGDLVTLVLMVLGGAAFYAGVSALLKLESFRFLLDVIRKLLHRGGAEEGEAHAG